MTAGGKARDGSRSTGRRADSRATRERLLAAVGRLLAHGHTDPTLQVVAEEAGVSTATAYRYFASAEDAVYAYVVDFPDSVAAAFGRHDRGETGLARLALWSTTWIAAVDEWGASLVHLRSPEGFLTRRATGDPVISAVCRHLEPPLLEAIRELGAGEDALPVALFLWNAIYDPREILDLRRTLRWTRGTIERVLLDGFVGAFRTATADPPRP